MTGGTRASVHARIMSRCEPKAWPSLDVGDVGGDNGAMKRTPHHLIAWTALAVTLVPAVGEGQDARPVSRRGVAQPAEVRVAAPPEIPGLIARLGSPKYREREAANAALESIGEASLEALRGAARNPDAEVRARAEGLMRRIVEKGSGLTRRIEKHNDAVFAVAFSPDGGTLLSAGGVNKEFVAKTWDRRTGAELRTFAGHTGWLSSAAFSPDGCRVVTASADLTVRLWDVETGRELRQFRGHQTQITSVAFSPDGRRVLSGAGHWTMGRAKDPTLRVWDVETGQEVRRIRGPEGLGVLGVAIAPGGRVALSGGYGGQLQLWDLDTGAEIRRFANTAGVRSVAFAADGRVAVSSHYDGTVRLWDVDTGAEVRAIAAHEGCASSVACSADGSRLVSGGWQDGAVRVWDVATGRRLAEFRGHSEPINGVAISADGREILSCAYDKSIVLWHLPGPAKSPR